MMKRKLVLMLVGLGLALALVACGGDSDASPTTAASNEGNTSETGQTAANEQAGSTSGTAELSDNFENALSPMGQLALGTLRLEDGDLAVTEEQAAELLPLWQALQSLSVDETTAQVELDAVVKQVQNTMSAEQVASIAEMKLTQDSLTELTESGDLGLRGFGGRNTESNSGGDFSPPAGGFEGGPPADGGGPGGGFGGGPGGGFGGGQGGGFGGGNLSEADIATRQAQFAQGDLGDMSERLLTGAVVRLLQDKTGQAPLERGGSFETVFEVVAQETGLSVEEVQAAMANAQSLSEIIEANGGDVEAVRAALIQAFEALPNAADFDAEELADQWLSRQ